MNNQNIEFIRILKKVDFNVVFLSNLLNDDIYYKNKTLYIDTTQFTLYENIMLKHVAMHAKYKIKCTSTLNVYRPRAFLIAILGSYYSSCICSKYLYNANSENLHLYIIATILYEMENVIIFTSQDRILSKRDESYDITKYIDDSCTITRHIDDISYIYNINKYMIDDIHYKKREYKYINIEKDYRICRYVWIKPINENIHEFIIRNLKNDIIDTSSTGGFLFLQKKLLDSSLHDWEIMDYVLSTGKLPIDIEHIHNYIKFNTMDFTDYEYNKNIYNQKLYKKQLNIIKIIEELVKYKLPKNRLSRRY